MEVFGSERHPPDAVQVATSQATDKMLKKLTQLEYYKPQLVEKSKFIAKDDNIVIPKELQQHVVEWHHHYLQYLGTKHKEKTIHAMRFPKWL